MTEVELTAQRSDAAQGMIVISLSAAADVWLLREPGVRRIYKLTGDEWTLLDADPRALLAAHFAPMPRVMFVPWAEAKLLVDFGFVHAVIADKPTELASNAVLWPVTAFKPTPTQSSASRTSVHIARYGGATHDRDSPLALLAFLRARPKTDTCRITGQLDDAEAEVLEALAVQHGASARVFIQPRSEHHISADTVVALRDDLALPLSPHVLGAVEQGSALITLGWPEERACLATAHFLTPLNPPLRLAELSPEGRAVFQAAHRGAVFSELEAALAAPPMPSKLKTAPSFAEALLAPQTDSLPLQMPAPTRRGPLPLGAGAKKPLRQVVETLSGEPRWLARALKLGLIS